MKLDPKDPQTWISRDLFESYCGAESEKLLRYYDKAVGKRNVMSFSLNWLALFLLPAWFGYRRQWQFLAVFTVLIAVLPFVEGAMGSRLPFSVTSGATLALGIMANGFVLMRANSHFFKLRKQGMGQEQIRRTLENKAAPSVPLAVVTVPVFIAVQGGAVVVADSIWGMPA